MIPVLEAEQSFVAAERVAVGMGRLKPGDHAAISSRWKRAAGRDGATSAKTPGGLVAALAAAGVPVRLVPRQAVTSTRKRTRKASPA